MTDTQSPATRPGPDPSALTTAQLLREVTALREIIEARLDAMDKAIALQAQYPTVIDHAVTHVRELYDEKFASIALQFDERDKRTEQTARDSKTAVDAAFQAQKEAAGKTEGSLIKQIDGLTTLLTSKTDSLGKEIGEVKVAQTLVSGRSSGASTLWALIGGGALLLIAVVGLVITLTRGAA